MRVCIHRGAAEIGGNCIELEACGKRLVLDLGRPLSAARNEHVPLPPVAGLADGNSSSLLGVVLSHPHQDQWGLVPQIHSKVPLWMGEAASNLLREASFFSRAGVALSPTGFLKHMQPFGVGPFRITPFLVDHSAFDSYALLVEADGRRLFYTGDFRGHNRKAALFESFLSHPPPGVDVLLLEGTTVAPLGSPVREEVTEKAVEAACVERFRATRGLALVAYSGQNIDRLVTLYRAAVKADRELVLDLYTASLARATGHDSIPRPGPNWPKVKLYVREYERLLVVESEEFERVDGPVKSRIYREHMKADPSRYVLTFRSSMVPELEGEGCLEGASLTWSLWQGYLDEDERLRAWAARTGLELRTLHSSGHAYPGALRRFVAALKPGATVPIHTGAPRRVAELLGGNVVLRRDGEWWEV